MIAIDTNIIVRLLTKDDPAQYKKSYALFQSDALWIPDTVILETEWVLRYGYEFTPAQICATFRKLFGLQNVHVHNPQLVAKVIFCGTNPGWILQTLFTWPRAIPVNH